jgi:hypothetical protein
MSPFSLLKAVPIYSLGEHDSESSGQWTYGGINSHKKEVDSVTLDGVYVNCLLLQGGTGVPHESVTTTVDSQVRDNGHGGVFGTLETTVVTEGNAQAVVQNPLYSGTATATINLRENELVTGGVDSAGGIATPLSDSVLDQGSSVYHHHLIFAASGAVNDFGIEETRNFFANGDSQNGQMVLTSIGGADRFNITHHTLTFSQTSQIDTNDWEDDWDRPQLTINGRVDVIQHDSGWIIAVTPIGGGDTVYSNGTGPMPAMEPPRDAFQHLSDAAANWADAVSGGLTRQFRLWVGYDDVVSYTSLGAKVGDALGTVNSLAMVFAPCQQVTAVNSALNSFRFAQGAGSALQTYDSYQEGDVGGMLLNGGMTLLSFSNFGRSCFAAGTPIPVEYGCKPVESVLAGDFVQARDENNPNAPMLLRCVLQTFVRSANIWHLYAGGKLVRTTGEHPFYVRNKGWTPAQNVQPADELRTDGGWVRCGEVIDTGRTETVYNLEVEDCHTYFAGDPVTWGWCLWAHNAGCRPVAGRAAHGDQWHNAEGVRRALALEAKHGRGNVFWNQALRDAAGNIISGAGKRPDIQVISGAKVFIQELQSVGQSRAFMRGLENVYRTILGDSFGGYIPVWHP